MQTNFDISRDREEAPMACVHEKKELICPHCDQSLCEQCELLHKFRIKKDIESCLNECEFWLNREKGDSASHSKKTNEVLEERVNCKIAMILQTIASTHRMEKIRLVNDAKAIVDNKSMQLMQKLKELSKKEKNPTPEDFKSLEKLSEEIDNLHLDKLHFLPDPNHERLVKRFQRVETIFSISDGFKSDEGNSSATSSVCFSDGKSFYKKLHVVHRCKGEDSFGEAIKSPLGIALVTARKMNFFSVVHGCRISLFSLDGRLVETIKLRNADFLLSGDIVADNSKSHIYLTARNGSKSCIYMVDLNDVKFKSQTLRSDTANSTKAKVFITVHGVISGLALSPSKKELFTIIGNELHGLKLADGGPNFHCALKYPNMKVLAIDDSKQCLYLAGCNGELLVHVDIKTGEQRIISVANTTINIRAATVDPQGNLIIIHSNTRYKILSSSDYSEIANLAGGVEHDVCLKGIAFFNPNSGSGKENKPIVALTDNLNSQINLMSI